MCVGGGEGVRARIMWIDHWYVQIRLFPISRPKGSMHHKLCFPLHSREGWSYLLAAAAWGEQVACEERMGKESHMLAAVKQHWNKYSLKVVQGRLQLYLTGWQWWAQRHVYLSIL